MNHTPESPPPGTSSANVIAAIASFFIPGLGQLAQARPLPAICYFAAAVIAWKVCLPSLLMFMGIIGGWGSPWIFPIILLVHTTPALDAALSGRKR